MRKDIFKEVVLDFQEYQLPALVERELNIPLELKNKVVTVIGFRRVGKTYYLYQIIKKLLRSGIKKDRILYVNFEDERLYPS